MGCTSPDCGTGGSIHLPGPQLAHGCFINTLRPIVDHLWQRSNKRYPSNENTIFAKSLWGQPNKWQSVQVYFEMIQRKTFLLGVLYKSRKMKKKGNLRLLMEVFKVSCSLKGEEDTPDVFLLFAQFFQLFPVRLLNWTLREVK